MLSRTARQLSYCAIRKQLHSVAVVGKTIVLMWRELVLANGADARLFEPAVDAAAME